MEGSPDNAFGALLKNGSWTGMRGQLQRKVKMVKICVYVYFLLNGDNIVE